MELNKQVKKILVVRYRFIGDTILTVPFLRNLRRAYPDAKIDMLVAPKSGEVIENCPYVDNFLFFDTTRKHKYENTEQKRKTFFHYVKLLRSNKYDKAYVLKRSLSSAILVFLAGIKERIGFDTEKRGFLLTKKVKYDNKKHEIECFLDVLKADDVEVKDSYLENWVDETTSLRIKLLLKEYGIEDKTKVIVHATATNPAKVWPPENFAKIIEYLANKKNVQVLYIGTDFDSKTYEILEALIKNELKIKPINLCGKFTLQESLAFIKKVDLLIGNDSGNLHMAASVGTKVIGIYGPMPFEKWCARGEGHVLLKSDRDCVPCSLKRPCNLNFACLKDIKVADVIKAYESMNLN